MTVTAAALADISFGDRPAGRLGQAAPRLLSHALLSTTALATTGVMLAGVALTAGWLLSVLHPDRHSDFPRSHFGLREMALAPLSPGAIRGQSPADIVVFPQMFAQAAQATRLAERVPLPRRMPARPYKNNESPNTVPLPPLLPEALASLRASQYIAAVQPSPPPAPPHLAALPRVDKPAPLAANHTAIYDISAHMVYLPNGKTLEAHSGLGDWRDDPRYVGLKRRGPTPPNTYELSLREGLFHGVRALRLTPVDDDKMFGRDGMLAHTYMLGPDGDSNGCVSFKDYSAFLQAYLNGGVDRLVVVPGRGAAVARFAPFGRNARYAANDGGPSSSAFSAGE